MTKNKKDKKGIKIRLELLNWEKPEENKPDKFEIEGITCRILPESYYQNLLTAIQQLILCVHAPNDREKKVIDFARKYL